MNVSRETYWWKTLDDHKLLREGAQQLGIVFSDEQISKLIKYIDLIEKWNDTINLVSKMDRKDIIIVHVLDSLAASKYFPKNAKTLLDFGSGAGLPGIPLKIILKELSIDLFDSRQKRTDFQKHTIRTLQLENIKAIHGKLMLENGSPNPGSYDLILFRAVGSLSSVLPLINPLLKDSGTVIAYKGPSQNKEPRFSSALTLTNQIEFKLPFIKHSRFLLFFQKNAGIIKFKPK